MTKTDQNVFRHIVGDVVAEKFKHELPKLREELLNALRTENEKLYGRYRDDILTKLDAFIKEIRDVRQEQSVHQAQHDRVNERVEQLEKIHPQGQHATT